MKIWFDRKPSSQPGASDCGDCAYTSSEPASIHIPFDKDVIQRIRVHRLELYNPLYTQGGFDEKWLVCNPTGSGHVAVLDAQAFMLLQQFRTAQTPLEVIQGFPEWPLSSVEEGVTLLHLLGFLRNLNDTSQKIKNSENDTLTAWLHVTNSCNLRCTYCYLDKTSEHMTEDVARRSIDAIFRSAYKQDFRRVRLKYAGGEASLHLSRLLELHDYAVRQAQQLEIDLEAHILSNGVILSQRTIDQLKARRIGVTISLDGVGTYHDSQRPFSNGLGSFKYVDRTITRLLQNGIVPYITVTVSQRNLDGLPSLMSYILEREMRFTLSYYRDNTCSTHVQDLQFSEEQMITAMRSVFTLIEQNLPEQCLLNSLIDKADLSRSHHHTCGVGVNSLVIDQHGGVAKCQADIKQRVTTIDSSDPLQAIKDDRLGIQGVSVDAKEGCRSCEWRYWCAGGCPLLTHRLTGRYDLQSPNCHIYKSLFPDVLRLEALRLLKYKLPVVLGNSTVYA
jgi:uncharacterized protein